jgi:myosin-6
MIDDSVKKVWVPDADQGFRLGKIVDIGTDTITVDPFDAPGRVSIRELQSYENTFYDGSFLFLKPISASYDSIYPAEEYENKDVDDNCGLMYLNQANLLNNIRLRYNKDIIYVSENVVTRS